MAAPYPPCWASEIMAELGVASPGWMGDLAGRGGGPGVPFWITEFSGRSLSVAIALSPQDQNEQGTSSSKLFAGVTATPASGSPAGYSWGIDYSEGGSFSISGGQGTASAGFTVSGVPVSGTAYATIYCDVLVNGVWNRGVGSLTYTRL